MGLSQDALNLCSPPVLNPKNTFYKRQKSAYVWDICRFFWPPKIKPQSKALLSDFAKSITGHRALGSKINFRA
jgi:hypothetical protein